MGNFVRSIQIYFDAVDKFARDGFMSQTNRKAAEEKKQYQPADEQGGLELV